MAKDDESKDLKGFLGNVFNDVRGDLGNAYNEILTQHSPISADYDDVKGDTWPSAPTTDASVVAEPLTGETLSPEWDFAPADATALEGQIIDADYQEIQDPPSLPSQEKLAGPEGPPQISGPDPGDDHQPGDGW